MADFMHREIIGQNRRGVLDEGDTHGSTTPLNSTIFLLYAFKGTKQNYSGQKFEIHSQLKVRGPLSGVGIIVRKTKLPQIQIEPTRGAGGSFR